MNPTARPLLSIVVPFYGVEDDIEECLESLRRQTLADLEVVLVDDGSPDGSRAVAERFAAADARFRLLTQANQGLGPARNTGAAGTRGRYLAFVDSDDVVPAGAYELLVGTLERTGSDIAAGNVLRLDRTGLRQSWAHAGPFARDDLRTHVLRRPDLVADRMVWNKVYRRSFWDAHGYTFPAIRYEDWPVTLAAHLDAVAVDVLAEPVYHWRDRESGGSITQAVYRLDNLTDRMTSAAMVLDLVRQAPPEVRRQVEAHLLHVDLAAAAQALTVVPADQRAAVTRLGQGLARRISPATARLHPWVDRLVWLAFRSGRGGVVRAITGLRGGAGPVRRAVRSGYRLLARTTSAPTGSAPTGSAPTTPAADVGPGRGPRGIRDGG